MLPHPHVVDLATMAGRAAGPAGFVVGLHAKSLRANMDVPAVAGVLAETVGELPGARLQINVHHEIFEPRRALLRTGAGRRPARAWRPRTPVVELHEHDYFSDDELWAYLSGLDVSVLPVPLRDALRVARGVPRSRHRGDRARLRVLRRAAAVRSYRHDEHGLDARSLARAVRAAPTPAAGAPRPRGRAAARSGGARRRAPRALRGLLS